MLWEAPGTKEQIQKEMVHRFSHLLSLYLHPFLEASEQKKIPISWHLRHAGLIVLSFVLLQTRHLVQTTPDHCHLLDSKHNYAKPTHLKIILEFN
jgi:hypothetical protein